MKKQLLLLVMILLPMVASADPVEIDGIYYNLITKGKIAEVTKNPNGYTETVVIPESVTHQNVDYSVTSICGNAFYWCKGLTSVTIPNSVTSIGRDAFCACSALTSVTIGNSVTSIEVNAFDGCSSLKKVIVSDIATWCGIKFYNEIANPLNYAHHLYSDENTEIKDLVVPNSVTSIGSYAFYSCSGLTSVTIPNSVTSIGNRAFWECSGLTSVTIPNSVTSIENSAFSGCTNLKSINISDLEAWCKISFSDYWANPLLEGHHLYLNGEEIKELVIPNSLTIINNFAFSGCSGLTSVTIPNSVTSIGGSAFRECSGLTSVTIPNSVTSFGSRAFIQCI